MRSTGGSRRRVMQQTVSSEMKPHDKHLNPHRSVSKKRELSTGPVKSALLVDETSSYGRSEKRHALPESKATLSSAAAKLYSNLNYDALIKLA